MLISARPGAAADWPMARGNAQRSGSMDDLPGPKAPKVLWVYKSAEHYAASPVPAGQAIFLGGIGAFNTGVFHSLATAADTPERLRWSKTPPYITRPTVCTPAVVEDLVVFGDGMHQTDDAILYCVRAADGLPVWQFPVPGKLVHLEAAPALDKGRVYICGGDAAVMCVDMKHVKLDGREQDLSAVIPGLAKRWDELGAKYREAKKQNPQLAVPPSEDALPKPVPKLLWQQGKGKWHIDAPPLVTGDFVLVASSYLEDEKLGKRCLACLRAGDGSVVWETPLEINPWAGPTLAGNLVLVGCSNIRMDPKLLPQAKGEVLAVDLATGKVRWRKPAAGGVLAPVAVKGDVAVSTATDGKVNAWQASTGNPMWAFQAKTPFFGGVAIAGDCVYAADLKAVVYALGLADGKPRWTHDVANDPSVQSRSMAFSSPVVHGGDLYLATCNLEGESDQGSFIACLSDKVAAAVPTGTIAVDVQQRRIAIPCKIAPRKLPTLKEVYPLEVFATYPSPRGQKAHETVVVFECKPSDVHKALASLGLKPGSPRRGEGPPGTGSEVRVYLELPSVTGKPRLVPAEKTMVEMRTGKTLPPIVWRFTGSVVRQINPDTDEKAYGADLGGTLITLYPVTDETVLQSSFTSYEERILKLETNRSVLPEEGTDVKLVLEAK
jgi:outer membrane protein assembly factor BamB